MKKTAIALLSAAFLFTACGGHDTKEEATQSSAQSLGIYDIEECKWKDGNTGAPAWSCNYLPSDDTFAAFAVGEARSSKYDATLSQNTAQAAGLAGLRQQIEAAVEKGVRQASVQTGAVGTDDETLDTANKQVLNLIVEGAVKNTRVLKTLAGPDGYTYVLMGVSRDGFEDMVKASVQSSMGNKKAQYQIFMADKIQEEFEKEFSKKAE